MWDSNDNYDMLMMELVAWVLDTCWKRVDPLHLKTGGKAFAFFSRLRPAPKCSVRCTSRQRKFADAVPLTPFWKKSWQQGAHMILRVGQSGVRGTPLWTAAHCQGVIDTLRRSPLACCK